MNRTCYRTIYSAVRGTWLAVAETVRGREGKAKRRGWGRGVLRVAALCALGLLPVLSRAQATLPIVPERGGAAHPVVGVSAAGVPLVNITAPNAAGVSMNRFTQFGVGTQGAVLVNSGQAVASRLAGAVPGNPFLGNAAARTIVNQVNSGHPTQLLGPTEIAGRRAHLVIANPAGISCAGCGFVNAPRVSLATGLARLNADGSLAGFDVTQGHLGVSGAGLDAHGSAIELIARAMTLNAQLWAESIDAVAGANQVDAASGAIQTQTGTGARPGVALDVQALGSMYANSVRLIGTEAGLGVRDAGQVTSLTGDLRVSSAGDVTIAPGARLQSAHDTHLTGTHLVNQGTVVSAGTARLAASQSLSNAGTLAAADAQLSAPTMTNAGRLHADRQIGLSSEHLRLDHGFVDAGHTLDIAAHDTLSNVGGTLSASDIALSGGTLSNDGGTVAARGALTIDAASLSNRAGTVSADTLSLTTAGALDNTQGQIAAHGARITAADVTNTAGQLGTTTGALHLSATGTVSNPGGQIIGADGLQLRANALNNAHGQLGTATGDASIHVTRDIANPDGSLASAGRLQLETAQLNNRAGTLAGGQGLVLSAERVDNTAGQLGSEAGDTHLRVTQTLTNAHGTLSAAGPLTVETGTLNNTHGHLSAAEAARIDAHEVINTAGQINASERIALTATDHLSNADGTLVAANALSVAVATLDNTAGQIGTTDGATTLDVTRALDNTQGRIASSAALTAHVGTLNNTHGTISGDALRLNVDDALTNTHGTIAATHDAVLSAAQASNRAGTIGAVDGALSLTTHDITDNTRGQLLAGGDTTLANAGLTNAAGTITGAHVTLASGTEAIDNTGGMIAAAQALTSRSGAFENRAGQVLGQGVTLNTGDLRNADGLISSTGSTHLAAASLTNDGGTLVSDDTLTIHSTGAVSNVAGQLGGNGDVTVHGTAIDNTRGALHAGGTLSVTGDTLRNAHTADAPPPATDTGLSAGLEGARVVLRATEGIDNTAGAIRADREAALSARTIDNTAGRLHSPGTVTLAASDTFINPQGDVNAGQQLTVSAGTLENAGTLQSAGDVTLNTQGDTHNSGRLIAGHDLAATAGGTLDNTGTLSAGHAASVSADTIHNAVTGEIIGGQINTVHARQRLTNAGLIDGGATTVTAGHTVTNTGRLYGDTVAIGAHTVINTTDAQGIGGVIAARDDLHIGAQTLENRPDALLYAGRDLHIGGALDAAGHALGRADSVTNDGAQIDAGRDIAIATQRFENLNSNFQTGQVTTDTGQQVWYQLPGATEHLAAADVALYQINNGATTHDWHAMGEDDYYRLVLPSTRYPASRYGPPFDYSRVDGARPGVARIWRGAFGQRALGPIGPAHVPASKVCTGGENGFCEPVPEQFNYTPEDRIWAVFGVTPPAGTCAPNDAACRAAYQALDAKIAEFNADFHTRLVSEWTLYDVATRTTTDVVTASQPGQISAGRDIAIDAHTGRNDKSQIVGGGDVTVSGVQDNAQAFGQQTVDASGSAIDTYVTSGGAFSGDTRAYDTAPYQAALPPRTIALPITAPTPDHAAPVKQVAANAAAAEGMRGTDVSAVAGPSEVPSIGTGTVAPGTVTSVHTELGGLTIRTVAPDTRLPHNALYRIVSDPGSRILVQTDARFTGARPWLSSDALLAALQTDPATVLKRLGDGFYEQQLVQRQILAATGQRFVGDYTDNTAQYQALMAHGVAAAERFQLNLGTALTPEQMAALTEDIVWLVEQTVTLPDGRAQTVLAPQVYLRAHAADVTGDGTLIAGKNVTLNTAGTLANSGTIASRRVSVISADDIAHRGTLAGGTVLASARQDLASLGGRIQGDTVALSAGRDLHLISTNSTAHTANGSATGLDRTATLNAGTLQVQAGRDLSASAAEIATTGDAILAAGRDVNLKTVHQYSQDAVQWDDKNRAEHSASSDTGTQLAVGEHLRLAAGRDVNATAAYAHAQGALELSAGRDVRLNTGEHSASARDEHEHEDSGILSATSTHTIDATAYTEARGTTLSGNTVTVAAGRDMTGQAATIAGTGDVNLIAGHDLTVGTAGTASREYHFKDVKKSGLGGAGAGISYGNTQITDTRHDTARGAQGSLLGSTDGSVHLQAGHDLHLTGTDLIAAHDITGTGANVTLDAAQTSRHHDETHEMTSSGVSLGIASPMLDAAQNVSQQIQASSASQDGRASALHAIAALGGAMDTLGAAAQAQDALKDGGMPESKVQLSFGTSHSKSTFTEDSTQHHGSTLKAGGTAAFIATGDGTPGSGDLTIQGSDVTAQDVLLQANHAINLVHSTDTDRTRSTNESSSANVGVSVGTGGFGVSASMSRAHGDANSDATTQNNTHLNASDTATIISGGDTNLIGANVDAHRVIAVVGGHLNLASVQDTSHSVAHQQSMGGGFSISQGGGSASFSSQHGSANGDYAGVHEQTGIQAGTGGFDIHVKGNTDLAGAYIASEAMPDSNHLSTGTLTFSDIENHSDYSASSSGFSAGGSFGNGGNNTATHGPASGKNTGGGMPMLSQNDSGSDSALTRSAISTGTVTIRDAPHQQQDLASLNRDTSHLNGTLAQTPDLQNLLNNQADMMAAVQAAGETVTKQIGNYADRKYQEAKAAGDEAGMAAWQEGGASRMLMQGAGAALVTGLGGGNAVSGAAGAMAASFAAGKLNELSGTIAESNPTGQADIDQMLGNIVTNALAGGIGVAVGGNAGAFAGTTVDRFNRQLHNNEKQRIAQHANGDKDKEERLTRAACYAVKCWAQYKPGSQEYNKNYVSQAALIGLDDELAWVERQKEAGLFNYTPGQKVTDMVKGDPVGVAKDATKMIIGGVTAKTGATVCATTGVGCATSGAWMVGFGLSDMTEGADRIYNRYNGINLPGTNPLRYGFNQISTTWGDTIYDGANLMFSIAALKAPVPLKMGAADGLNRPGSIFGVTVPRINNNTLLPFVNRAAPYGTTQGILLIGVGSKGTTVINDARNAGDQK